MTDSINIGGVTKFSTIDFPGHLSAVVFTRGCPLHCRYCHNADLRGFSDEQGPSLGDVVKWLDGRKGLLDGVVFSGGEPTSQKGLIHAVQVVKDMGFDVGLHTSGVHPVMLKKVAPYLTWVGLDIKQIFTKYKSITGVECGHKVRESLEYIIGSGVGYEIRTTYHPLLISREDMDKLSCTLEHYRVEKWSVQEFRSEGCVDDELN